METEAIRTKENRAKPVSFGEAFWFWVKLGFINFGDPQDKSRSCIGNW